jgi:hypothetical protein
MTTVVIADTTHGLLEALDTVFAPFGGVGQAWGSVVVLQVPSPRGVSDKTDGVGGV